MTEQEHKQRHEVLHNLLDELIADYIASTNEPLVDSTIAELMAWSNRQRKCPDNNSLVHGVLDNIPTASSSNTSTF